MRAYVFTDRALASYAGQFAWLSIDTEKAGNSPVLEKYPVTAWPSMFLVDPRQERVIQRWTGGATVEQLRGWLDQSRKAGQSEVAGARSSLAVADSLYGEGKYKEAAAAYQKALPSVTAAELPRVADALLFSLTISNQPAACAKAARDLLSRPVNQANAAAAGLDCALSMPEGAPARPALIQGFEKRCREALADAHAQLSADDRSGLYQELIQARQESNDEAGKKKLEAEWIAMLEKAAAAAPNPEARAVFDSHRLSAYIETGHPERAIPVIEASERDLPGDYNPPARLAVAYKEMKEYDKALAASDRALAKAYGPRRLGILRTRADIYAAKGDKAAARDTLRKAIAEAEAMPKAQVSQRQIEGLKKKLAEI